MREREARARTAAQNAERFTHRDPLRPSHAQDCPRMYPHAARAARPGALPPLPRASDLHRGRKLLALAAAGTRRAARRRAEFVVLPLEPTYIYIYIYPQRSGQGRVQGRLHTHSAQDKGACREDRRWRLRAGGGGRGGAGRHLAMVARASSSCWELPALDRSCADSFSIVACPAPRAPLSAPPPRRPVGLRPPVSSSRGTWFL